MFCLDASLPIPFGEIFFINNNNNNEHEWTVPLCRYIYRYVVLFENETLSHPKMRMIDVFNRL